MHFIFEQDIDESQLCCLNYSVNSSWKVMLLVVCLIAVNKKRIGGHQPSLITHHLWWIHSLDRYDFHVLLIYHLQVINLCEDKQSLITNTGLCRALKAANSHGDSYQSSAQEIMHKVLPGDLNTSLTKVEVCESCDHACRTNGKVIDRLPIPGKLCFLQHKLYNPSIKSMRNLTFKEFLLWNQCTAIGIWCISYRPNHEVIKGKLFLMLSSLFQDEYNVKKRRFSPCKN